ncbi:MAG: hypothetical protein JXR76_16975 [Deltaproteobacteria bacterium]|nr:hypothetical protein [Deltaproteobacteria bacterium]
MTSITKNTQMTNWLSFKLNLKLVIALVLCTGTAGCFSSGGNVGLRKSFKYSARLNQNGVYGGPSFGIHLFQSNFDEATEGLDDDESDNPVSSPGATVTAGFTYSLFFSSHRVFHTFLPTVTVLRHPAHTIDFADKFGWAPGGSLGMGIEWGKGAPPGFHTALCGGVYGMLYGLGCGRLSTRNGGWMGFDFAAGHAAPFMPVETLDLLSLGSMP